MMEMRPMLLWLPWGNVVATQMSGKLVAFESIYSNLQITLSW